MTKHEENSLGLEDIDLDFDAEFEIDAKERKGSNNQTFIVIAIMMIILFLTGLGTVLFLAVKPEIDRNLSVQTQTQSLPSFDKDVLEFPEGTTDWKFSFYQYTEIYYCEIFKKWHRCYPVKNKG